MVAAGCELTEDVFLYTLEKETRRQGLREQLFLDVLGEEFKLEVS